MKVPLDFFHIDLVDWCRAEVDEAFISEESFDTGMTATYSEEPVIIFRRGDRFVGYWFGL